MMNSNILIKSIPNGIRVNCNPDCSFSDLLEETARKFGDSKGFFKDGKLAVTFNGRVMTEEEEASLVKVMEENGGFTVTYLISPDETGETKVSKALSKAITDEDLAAYSTIYRGSIHKGEHVKFESGVLIVGDVEPGGLVMAEGNVIILGGLYGSVNIDFEEEDKPGFIYASDMSFERIRIGQAREYSEKAKWSIRPKYQAKLAYVKDGKIVVEAVNSKMLGEFSKNV